jgi:leader peptidase (prepilin peptidase) / N-methyltransferase
MELSLAALVFAPALAVGSFLNVVAARLPRRESLVRPGSHCDACGTALAWHDNLPLVSYAVLRGRCRHCGAKYGLRHLIVELATAFLVAGVFARFGLTGEAFVAVFFVACLVVLSVIDVEHRILPDAIVLPATAVVLAAQIALFPERAIEWPLAAVSASGFLFLALLAYPRGMGMGDVKLALLMGAALGKSVAVAMMIGMLAALVIAIFLLARHGSVARKTAIPFGPFLAAGSIVAIFAGERLLSGYLDLF